MRVTHYKPEVELEEWREIHGYDHQYEVSNLGNVRKRKRASGEYRPIVGGWAKGYRLVLLRKNGKRVGKTVHSLVLEAFIGPRPEGMIVRHLNGDKLDNRLSNLAWGTYTENSLDRWDHGTMLCGERSPNAKLTNEEADFIRSSAMQTIWLARSFGVTPYVVRDIRGGRSRVRVA